MIEELTFQRAGRLAWTRRPEPQLQAPTDAIVRPFLAARRDGDTVPIHHPGSRLMQAGLKAGLLDPAIGHICGPVPFRGPFAIGHECVAEVVAVGSAAADSLSIGQVVVVPWAVSLRPMRRM